MRNENNCLHDLKKLLPSGRYGLREATVSADIHRLLEHNNPDLILICSFEKATSDGLETVIKIRRKNPRIPIIFLTRYSSESKAIAALRAGVNDYFKMPYSGQDLLASFERHLPGAGRKPTSGPAASQTCSFLHQSMIGDSTPMREVAAYIAKIAATDSTVLITGETGTGKELVAERIHCKSLRSLRPFVSINCAALPESLVESELFGFDRGAFTGAVTAKKGKLAQAQGGTVFLDEIGDMSPYAQAKILRSIEKKEVYPLGGSRVVPLDIRVIAATNQEPEELISGGIFRRDLYYRLNVARVQLPPLRDRKEDIPRLVAYSIQKLNRRFKRKIKGLTEEAMTCLLGYEWPGNIRELMNLLEASYINLPSRSDGYMDLPKPLQQQLKATPAQTSEERSRILDALLRTNWNKSTAAKNLHWSRMTLYRKMAKYHIVAKKSPSR